MGYYSTIDNTKIYYEIQGTGQPIIFIHGWSCSTETFAPVVDGLKDKYQCISYDHRGHGASSCPKKGLTITQLGKDLRELINYLNLENVVLVGHSMGGATIYSYISQFGCDKLSKVVIIDMSPKLISDDEWKAGCASGKYCEKDYWEDMESMAQDMGQFMWKFWRIVLPEFAKMPNELGELIGPGLIGENNEHVLISLWHSMFYLDYRDTIKNITVPTAYFIPGHGLYPKESAEFIKNNASANVRIVEFPDCSHMITLEAVEQSIKEIDSFISNIK